MRRTMAKASLHTAANLLLFALVGTALLAYTYELTHGAIERSIEQERLKLIAQIAPPTAYDNEIMKDTVQVAPDEMLGTDEPSVVYRGRLNGEPSIAILQAAAPGYSGRTRLIVAIHRDGRIGGVRVVSHSETPGLGDYIEIAKSDWITGFDGASLENTRQSEWKVKKDGGKFDYRAGATITPRSIVKAVHRALQYYALHRDELFRESTTPAATASEGGNATGENRK